MLRKSIAGCGLVALCLASLPASAVRADEAVELKPTFPSGRVSYIEIEEKMVNNMPTMTMKFETVNGMIEKANPSDKKVTLTYERAGLMMDMGAMGKTAYDSDMPGGDDAVYVKQVLQPMIGKSLTLTLDDQNNIKSVSGMEPILKEIEKDAAANPFFAQMKEGFTDQMADLTWGSGRFAVLPDKPVKPGETWETSLTMDLPQMGKLRIDYKCKLDRVEKSGGKKLAHISYTGKLNQLEKDEAPMAMTLKDGELEGTVIFDVDGGQVVKRSETSEMKSSMSMGPDEASKMDMSMTRTENLRVSTLDERKKQKEENRKAAEAKKKADKEDDESDMEE